MWTSQALLAVLALCAGCAVSAGAFAFLFVIGVIPRMLGMNALAKYVILVENMVILGLLFGVIASIFPWTYRAPGGVIWISLYGLSAGMFVGCIAASLAEILHTFPVMFRRFRIKRGLAWVMAAMAFGKTVGSLFYFLAGYAIL